jgi:hypothetical protein
MTTRPGETASPRSSQWNHRLHERIAVFRGFVVLWRTNIGDLGAVDEPVEMAGKRHPSGDN